MEIDYRSAFCNLAYSMFVDHEPFNPVIVPSLCRMVLADEDALRTMKMPKMNAYRKQRVRQMTGHLASLVERTLKFIQETCSAMEAELVRKSKLKTKQQHQMKEAKEAENEENLFTNQLVYNVVRMVSTIIQYDMLNLLQLPNKQSEIFSLLV